VAIASAAATDASTMAVNAVRVPLIQILIEDFGQMTVSTAIIGSSGATMAGESGMAISAIRRQSFAVVMAAQSSMTVDGRLKWVQESDTSESWSAISDNSESWTPIDDTSETWSAISDDSESWSPIADNSETWQIAA
jgi:hypothetical protein